MDMSKLPKLSQSDRPAPPEQPAPIPENSYEAAAALQSRDGAGAEAWISIAFDVIPLLLSPRLLQYLFSPSTFPQKWTFFDPQGNPLTYTRSVFFWGDLALTAFALVLIVEGLVLIFARRAAPVAFAFA